MAARKQQIVDPADQSPQPQVAGRPREAREEDVGDPNPAILDQLHRLAEFAGDAPEPRVVRYSGPVRVAVFVAAAVVPWALIALAVKLFLFR